MASPNGRYVRPLASRERSTAGGRARGSASGGRSRPGPGPVEQIANSSGLLGRGEVLRGLLEIRSLQLSADEPAALLERDVAFASDACERRENRIPGIRPKVQAATDDVELQRADVALVVVLAGAFLLERVARVDVHPH